MAGKDLFSKGLFVNAALAALAGFVSAFGAFLVATPKPTSTSVYVSAAAGAAYGALRLFVGAIAAAADKPLGVDS